MLTNFHASMNVVGYHHSMLQDRARTRAYRDAIFETVEPGDVVVDIGCGSGILSLFACQAGARRVYAIEAGPAIEIAREMSRRNGLDSRISFINDRSARARIDELADVIVTETLWNFGLGEGILRSLVDARRRLLKEGGRIVPLRLDSWLVPVEAPDIYESLDEWPDEYGLDMGAMRELVMNNVHRRNVDRDAFLADPGVVAGVDTSGVDETDVRGSVAFTATRHGTVHGVAGWFTAQLSPGVSLTNAPPNPAPNWGHAFFPIDEPFEVSVGERLHTALRSAGNEEVWSWTVRPGDGDTADRFDQSTFRGFPLSPEEVHRRSSGFRPTLNESGRLEAFVLAHLDGSRAVSEIDTQARERFPDAFPSPEAASAFVRDVVARYAG